MTTLLVLYAGDYGNTEKMARAAAEAVNGLDNMNAVLKKNDEVTPEDMIAADGILAGTPVHMGSMDWQMKKVIDTTCSGLWMKDALVGKAAGVFATGGGFGSAGGGVELTLVSLLNNFAELGMVIVPLPKSTPNYQKGGLQWGPYGRTQNEASENIGMNEEVLELVKRHAVHVARVAEALKGKVIFS